MKKNRILIADALEDIISDLNQPVITDYTLGVFVFNLYKKNTYKDMTLNKKLLVPSRREYSNSIYPLIQNNILTPFEKISNTYRIFGKKIKEEEEVICSVDPFAYISHLSAMEYHGLTDRISRSIIYSSPAPADWKKFAKEKMLKDYSHIEDSFVPLANLSRKEIEKFGKKNINRISSKHLGAYINVSDKQIRISSIGRTFLDMLKKPDLCGGIQNVIDAYEEFGEQYLNLIIDEIDRNGNKIETVRAGYILEEVCGIKHEVFDKWCEFAQRGGSRKLDPNSEYMPEYSERWCISINA